MHLNTHFKIHVSFVLLLRKMYLIIPLPVGLSFLFCGLSHLATSQCQARNPLNALAWCCEPKLKFFALHSELTWHVNAGNLC